MYKERVGQSGLTFTVVGISDEGGANLNADILDAIKQKRIFSGGIRHHELVRHLLPEGYVWIDVVVPLEHVFERYRCYEEPILVFASGDPLFFGYTTTLMREFPGQVVKTYPYFNSLQLLCHALTLPYHEMRVCSLTGRPWHEFDRALIERSSMLGVLTDRKNTPSAIAERMLEYGYSKYQMHIGVRLGGARQELYTLSLGEVVGRTFEHPNCLIIEATEPLDYASPLGLDESEFHLLNGRAKMITKMPIRLLSLSLMELHKRRYLWDVGFCTGSVSIEAKLQFPHLHVRSFEIRTEGEELMSNNSRRFGTPGIAYHVTDFMDIDVSSFEQPDAVFIGGHGGKMEDFLCKITKHIHPDGVIVFNSVSTDTLSLFRDGIERLGWYISREMRITLDEHNPITILQARPGALAR